MLGVTLACAKGLCHVTKQRYTNVTCSWEDKLLVSLSALWLLNIQMRNENVFQTITKLNVSCTLNSVFRLRSKWKKECFFLIVTKTNYFSAALDLWISREVRVLYSIGNCFLGMKVRWNTMPFWSASNFCYYSMQMHFCFLFIGR